MTAASTKERRHLVAVWNPSYASNAMEEHLRILLELAQRSDREELSQDDVYVWWGKVRSPNRQQRQAHQDDIRAIGEAVSSDAETHLYLTDYRSLYVADLDEVIEGDLDAAEAAHVPEYYDRNQLHCDFWFRVVDIRRLVGDDLVAVIDELRALRNVHYSDRPVSLYGGMVDLPLVVTRPDGRRYFDSEEYDDITDGKLWAQWDAERAGLGAIEIELRDNLFGATVWNAFEPTARNFIATGERVFRAHRRDPAFDFANVLGSFAKALEVQCNAILRRALRNATPMARLAKVGDGTRDITTGRPLSIGELARVIGGEERLADGLRRAIEPKGSAQWFANQLPAILDEFADIRNAGTHAERVNRETATRWRDRLVGVGSVGDFTELGRVKVR